MKKSGYEKFLAVFLTIIIIAIVGILGYVLYDYFYKLGIDTESRKKVDEFKNNIKSGNTIEIGIETDIEDNVVEDVPEDEAETYYYPYVQYHGIDIIGLIEIPVIGLEYPVLAVATVDALNTAVGYLYGPRIKQTR